MTTGFPPGREALRNVDAAISAVARPVECDRSVRVIDISNIDLFLGLDVGKGEHHATAVTPAGTGADPADPDHRYMLQTAVIGARLLDWPHSDL